MEIESIKKYSYDTLVVGSGCAGYNAIDWLWDLGRRNICMITEGIHKGTSRNTGSDKQTYYKLSLASRDSDSVYELAETLYKGEGVEGDIALTEAANSVRAFMKLAALGVAFPTNSYGEYVGYKTDHDPRSRATSAGPLTSKVMTEKLEASVKSKGISIYDQTTAIKPVIVDGKIKGLIALHQHLQVYTLCYYQVKNIIWCTGGQSNIYYDSVYPLSQTGMNGILYSEGVQGVNLSEWQYGLASTKYRWNVSGTYQQVLPRYISVDTKGNEYEFLYHKHQTPTQVHSKVFLKGYQWPFDVKKIGGSSDIDLWVYHETEILNRKVYMDFRRNPSKLSDDFSELSKEARAYLEKSEAFQDTPIKRLEKMNPLAINLYKKHKIDLYVEPLEVKVCVQHHNGGILVDSHWLSTIEGLYVAGEAAGTFGCYRPGGSALNATQVGSMRAAQHICRQPEERMDTYALSKEEEMVIQGFLKAHVKRLRRMDKSNQIALKEVQTMMQKQMSLVAAHSREIEGMKVLKNKAQQLIQDYDKITQAYSVKSPIQLYKYYDMLQTQSAVLSAMIKSGEIFGSRGSGKVITVVEKNKMKIGHHVKLLTKLNKNNYETVVETVAPIPKGEQWFEKVWAEYRDENKVKEVYEEGVDGM